MANGTLAQDTWRLTERVYGESVFEDKRKVAGVEGLTIVQWDGGGAVEEAGGQGGGGGRRAGGGGKHA